MVHNWDGKFTIDNEIEKAIWVDSATNSIKQGSIFQHKVIPKLKAQGLIH